MDLKKIDLNKLQDYAFTPYEIADDPMVSNQKFINFKCLDNESLIPTVKAIPLDLIKQARDKMHDLDYLINDAKYSDQETRAHNVDILVTEFYEIMDKLIESDDCYAN